MHQESTMGVNERAYRALFFMPPAAGCGVTHGGMCDPSTKRGSKDLHIPNPTMINNGKRMVELVNQ